MRKLLGVAMILSIIAANYGNDVKASGNPKPKALTTAQLPGEEEDEDEAPRPDKKPKKRASDSDAEDEAPRPDKKSKKRAEAKAPRVRIQSSESDVEDEAPRGGPLKPEDPEPQGILPVVHESEIYDQIPLALHPELALRFAIPTQAGQDVVFLFNTPRGLEMLIRFQQAKWPMSAQASKGLAVDLLDPNASPAVRKVVLDRLVEALMGAGTEFQDSIRSIGPIPRDIADYGKPGVGECVPIQGDTKNYTSVIVHIPTDEKVHASIRVGETMDVAKNRQANKALAEIFAQLVNVQKKLDTLVHPEKQAGSSQKAYAVDFRELYAQFERLEKIRADCEAQFRAGQLDLFKLPDDKALTGLLTNARNGMTSAEKNSNRNSANADTKRKADDAFDLAKAKVAALEAVSGYRKTLIDLDAFQKDHKDNIPKQQQMDKIRGQEAKIADFKKKGQGVIDEYYGKPAHSEEP
ncbi:MAG: hypothetical protein LBJ92_03420 [Holosporales bacterium]|jgi:hypothetical protein|nr:hypothetical protein [Holosporales bacterium]